MIHITLTPVRMDEPLALAVEGETLTFNGEAVDLAGFTACPWIVGQPQLAEDGWHVGIILPHGGAAPEETRFPAPITVTADGPVDLPPYDASPADEEEVLT